MRLPSTAALVLAASLGGCAGKSSPPPLPALNVALNATTVSGLSSGGYMAVQYQVAFAAETKGAGIFAAGPWGCARGELALALQDCFDAPQASPPVPELLAQLRAAARAGEVGPVEALADDRVWWFRGTQDTRVAAGVMAALDEFYAALIPPAQRIRAPSIAAGHALPTESVGSACAESVAPYLAACGFDGVGSMLAAVSGSPAQPVNAPGELRPFDQRPYDPDGQLDRTGYLYVPAACGAGHTASGGAEEKPRAAMVQCPLHIAFHGCQQGHAAIGEAFVRDGGYGRAADRHGVVVLFPQVAASYLAPFNPKGCWDWWGYTGKDYLSRRGSQLAAVHAMASALALTPER